MEISRRVGGDNHLGTFKWKNKGGGSNTTLELTVKDGKSIGEESGLMRMAHRGSKLDSICGSGMINFFYLQLSYRTVFPKLLLKTKFPLICHIDKNLAFVL